MATRYSIVELLAQADATLPDNTTQLIDPADVRDMIKNFLTTMAPAYGGINIPATPGVVVALNTTTPVVIAPFASVVAASGEMTANAAAGQVTQQIAAVGNTGASARVTFTADVVGANNADVTFTLYKNGVATPFRDSVTCGGAGNFGALTFGALVYTGGVDAVFEIRATTTNAGNYTISNALLLVENVPVNSFV
jgi:hypothetical protein